MADSINPMGGSSPGFFPVGTNPISNNQMANTAPILQALQGINQILGQINTTLNALLPVGAYIVFQRADAGSPNDSFYYSTTTSKLTYRDPSGTLHALY